MRRRGGSRSANVARCLLPVACCPFNARLARRPAACTNTRSSIAFHFPGRATPCRTFTPARRRHCPRRASSMSSFRIAGTIWPSPIISMSRSTSRGSIPFWIAMAFMARKIGRKNFGTLIRDADTIVFVLSPSSAVSEACAWEVERASALGKKIVPVVARPLGETKAPSGLAKLNYIYFYPEQKKPGSGVKSGSAELIKALNLISRGCRSTHAICSAPSSGTRVTEIRTGCSRETMTSQRPSRGWPRAQKMRPHRPSFMWN